MNTPIDRMTADGIDLQFGTNVVGHYLFTKRLMPLLIAGAEQSGTKSRTVHTSSSAMMFTDTVDLDVMKDPVALKKLGSGKMYMESKFVR
jgi:retinol dehydrogenase-12